MGGSGLCPHYGAPEQYRRTGRISLFTTEYLGQDFVMYRHFVKFREYAEKVGLDAEFKEIEGYDHEWRFRELCIQDAIEKFLPGDEKVGNAF